MAANNLSFLNELNESKDFWSVKARVIRKWTQNWRLDVILLDENGNKMQGYVRDRLMPQFDNLLVEDAVVIIRNCGVGSQLDTYPVLALDKKIIFYQSTEVTPAVGWVGHPYGFFFKEFSEITAKLMKDALTVDVIGIISWCGNLDIFKSQTGKETKRLHLDLQNLNGDVQRCTFWGNYGVQVSEFIAEHGHAAEQPILIVQHGKIKDWNDVLTIQNDMFGTRLFLNAQVEDSQNLRNSLKELRGAHGNSQSILTSQSNYPARNDFIVNANRKTIEEVRELKPVRGIHDDPKLLKQVNCVVLATIKMLEEDAGWYYPGCRKCRKKVLPTNDYLRNARNPHPEAANAPEDTLWCPKCNCQAVSIAPKFRLQFRVQDHTGCISFLMFDEQVSRLTDLTADDIRQRQISSGDSDKFPHELQVLVSRRLGFQVVVSEYNTRWKHYVYTVNKVCDDHDIITEMAGEEAVNQVTPEHGNPETSAVRLSQSSQGATDSKDAASGTNDYLAPDSDKDSGTSPVLKRPGKKLAKSLLSAEDTPATKRLKKKLEPYDV